METLILIIVLAVVFVAVVVEGGWLTLVRPRRRRRGQPIEVVSPPERPGQGELRTPAAAGAAPPEYPSKLVRPRKAPRKDEGPPRAAPGDKPAQAVATPPAPA